MRSSPVASARAMTVRFVEPFASWWQTLCWQNPQNVHSPRPSPRLRVDGGRSRERVPPEARGGVGDELAPAGRPHRRHREPSRARPVVGVAIGAADAELPLHAVVEGLQVVVGEGPVGERRALGDGGLAVALDDRAAAVEVPGQEADAEAVVVDGRAAHRVHHERRPGGRAGLDGVVLAPRRLLVERLGPREPRAGVVADLVERVVVAREPRSRLQSHHVEARGRQDVRGDPARGAEADDRDVRLRQALGHASSPMRCSGSVHTACGPP